MKRVLFLDIATTTGFAVDRPDGSFKPLSGCFRCSHSDDDIGDAYVEFEDHVLGLIAVHLPDVLAFEAPLVMQGGEDEDGRPKVVTNHQTVRKLFGLAAIAELIGSREDRRRRREGRDGLEVYEVNLQSVRSHAFDLIKPKYGTKHFPKHQLKAVVMECCALLGFNVAEHNAGDACLGWDFTRHKLHLPGATTPALIRYA